ncbi:MAG: hypothetical protein WB771_04395 [Solirubrobacterales bacterium]
MSALSALRPGHWIGIGLIAALVASGAWTNAFGLLGGNATEAKQLNSCLQHHGVSMAAVVTSVGNPATLLGGAKATNQLIHHAARNGRIKNPEANVLLACLRRVAR